MLTRFHKILIALLAVQLVLAVVMLLRPDDDAVAAERPLLAGFDAAKVTQLQITSSAKPDAAPINLVKRGDGWVLASHFDYPVDSKKVSDMLTPLAKMAAASPIATQTSRHKQLKVADADHERKLVITTDGGKPITLFVGSSAGLRRTAVRLAGEDRVFAVTGVSAYAMGTEANQWIDTSYVQLQPDEVAKVLIERDGHRTELSRANAQTPWSATIDGAPIALAKDETLDTSAIDSIVASARTISIKAPGDPKHDASKPAATITLEKFAEGATSVAPIVVDVVADNGAYWVRQRGMERAGLVEKARLDTVLDVKREKLVKVPPPPGAGSGSAAAPAMPGGIPPGMQPPGLPPGFGP